MRAKDKLGAYYAYDNSGGAVLFLTCRLNSHKTDVIRWKIKGSLGDSLHEMSKPIFGENKKNIFNSLSAELTHRMAKLNKGSDQTA